MDPDGLSAAARKRVGSTLKSKYRLDGLIGIGGGAAVYAATHTNGRRYAVKVQHPYLSADPEAKRRFVKEGYAANAVAHPAAVSIFDDDSDGDLVYLVMELLEGESLQAKAEAAGGRLGVGEVVEWTLALLACLGSAHEHGVLHRDLKPSNLFVTRDGALRLLDFGTARVRELSSSTLHTAPFTSMGTVAFMSPEQARGRTDLVDARSDVWSVGATLFKLLSGRYVHEAATTNERLALAMTVPPRSVATVAPELPPQLVAVIDRALAFEPADRWQSAAELRRALAGADLGSPRVRTSQPSATPRFGRRRWAVALSITCVVALLAWFSPERTPLAEQGPSAPIAHSASSLAPVRVEPPALRGVPVDVAPAPSASNARSARVRSSAPVTATRIRRPEPQADDPLDQRW